MDFGLRSSTGNYMSSLFKMNDISDKTQSYLTKVYTNLTGCIALCALGMYLNANVVMVTGFFSQILMIGAMMYALCQAMDRTKSDNQRMAWCMGIALGKGLLLGPYIHTV